MSSEDGRGGQMRKKSVGKILLKNSIMIYQQMLSPPVNTTLCNPVFLVEEFCVVVNLHKMDICGM